MSQAKRKSQPARRKAPAKLPAAKARPAKLRLVKVAVQPIFVLDDGENITEIEHAPTIIPAEEWPTYSGERFPREVAAWQARLDAGAE